MCQIVMDSLYRNVEGGGKYVDLEPLNSDEKDLTNAIKVRVSKQQER